MNQAADLISTRTAEQWSNAPLAELVAHILQRYHEGHREQLRLAIELALKVEQVHDDHADCPHGLAEPLHDMLQELECHIRKEEQVLVPLITQGLGPQAGAPINDISTEHDQPTTALVRLDTLP